MPLLTASTDLAAQIFAAIDAGTAVKIVPACFRDGEENEHEMDFYRLGGDVISVHYNRRTTETICLRVGGEDREIFDLFYPA